MRWLECYIYFVINNNNNGIIFQYKNERGDNSSALHDWICDKWKCAAEEILGDINGEPDTAVTAHKNVPLLHIVIQITYHNHNYSN